ncbi:MAG: hypothetical protein ACE5JQ_16285 [Candidatus Methylomirabilales bacterium]
MSAVRSDSPPEGPPVLEGVPPSEEQKRLVALFDEMEKKQVDFLDQASKRIVELCVALLGVFFAVIALGDTYPPPFLQGNDPARVLTFATLAFYLAAMLTGVLAIQPREYRRYRYNLTEMRNVLDEIVRFKKRWVQVAGILFVLGSLTLALLVGAIIFAA